MFQIELRVDDNNHITVAAELQAASPDESTDIPEVIAARVVNSKLSDLGQDQLLNTVGQIVDHLTTVQQAPVDRSGYDWRADFRRGK